jgi:outer membrane lipoprotein carrier protein
MRAPQLRALTLALLVPASALAQPLAARRTAAQVLADVEATYAKPQHLTARFQQTVTYATMGTTRKSGGTVYLAKPDKMRWDYVDAKNKVDSSFIFDGTVLWVVQPSNLQVLKHTAQNTTLPAAISFLNQAGRLAKEFDVTFPAADVQQAHGVPGGVLLALAPKQASAQIEQLYFVVDPSTNQVTRSIVIDSSDNINAFVFTGVDLKKKIDAKYFAFDPKTVPTYKVVTVNPAPAPQLSPKP